MKGCRFKILPVSTVKNAHPPYLRGGGRGGEGEEGRERRRGRGGEVKNENITFQVRFNPLQPKVSMHILHTALSTFSKGVDKENQELPQFVIISVTLVTFMCDSRMIL